MDVSKLMFKTQIFLPKHTYFSGETIRGQVIVVNGTGEPQRLREIISVTFNGFTRTNLGSRIINANTSRCSSALSLGNQRNSIGQDSHEIHLQRQVFLTPADFSSVVLAPGQNGFPFQFNLPAALPSTFTSHLGMVQYDAMTSFSVGHRYPMRISHKVIFRVINSQDLNLHSLAGLNSYFSFEKTLPMRSTRSGNGDDEYAVRVINANVQLPSQGYIPGEFIYLSVELSHTVGFCIQTILVELINETTYKCPSGSLSESKVILSSSIIYQKTWGKQVRFTARLEIPSKILPSTPLNSSYLISTKYCITIKTKLPTGLLTIAKVPVTIGTIPLRQIQSRANSVTSQRSLSSRLRQPEIVGTVGGHVQETSVSDQNESDDDSDVPPSYLEALSMTNGPFPVPTEFEAENN